MRVLRYEMCKSKKEDKDQESIQSSTTPDPGYQWESDNVEIRHHKREPSGQPFPSRWPQGIKLSHVMANMSPEYEPLRCNTCLAECLQQTYIASCPLLFFHWNIC